MAQTEIGIKENDIVKFCPIAGTEIYHHNVPRCGTVGTIKRVGIDTTMLLLWGVVMPICEVQFGDELKLIYLEDLKKMEDRVGSRTEEECGN